MILVDSVSGLLVQSAHRRMGPGHGLHQQPEGLFPAGRPRLLPPSLIAGWLKRQQVGNRGYYFDILQLEKYLLRNQTPATPAISLMYALDRQLDDMVAEGMEARFARHLAMRDRTIDWATSRGFSLFAAEGYRSPTVTCIDNDRGLDIGALNQYLRQARHDHLQRLRPAQG
jgi:aspartate aminotransferase-like enzyme